MFPIHAGGSTTMRRPTVAYLVAFGSREYKPPEYFFNMNLLKFDEWPSLGLIDHYGHSIEINRNKMAESALERSNCEWFLWVDSDQALPRGVIWRLLSWDKPFVAALVFKKSRESGYGPVFYHHEGDTHKMAFKDVLRYLKPYADLPITNEAGAILPPQGALLPIGAAGFGCVLTHRSMFEKIPKPWFAFRGMSEDLYFCKLAREAGYQLYGDMGCIVGHAARHNVTHRTFLNVYGHLDPDKIVVDETVPVQLQNEIDWTKLLQEV